MEPLTWTGALGPVLNPLLLASVVVFAISVVAQIVLSVAVARPVMQGPTLAAPRTVTDFVGWAVAGSFALTVAVVAAYLIIGLFLPSLEAKGIVGAISTRLLPVWISLIVLFAVSFTFKRKLGLYGKLFDSIIGMIGFALVMFGSLSAFSARWI